MLPRFITVISKYSKGRVHIGNLGNNFMDLMDCSQTSRKKDFVYFRELSRLTIRRRIYPSATILSLPLSAVQNFATPSSKPGGYSSIVDLPSFGDTLVTMSRVTDLCQPLANNLLSTVTEQSCEKLRGGENLKNLLQTRLPPGDKKEIDGEFIGLLWSYSR